MMKMVVEWCLMLTKKRRWCWLTTSKHVWPPIGWVGTFLRKSPKQLGLKDDSAAISPMVKGSGRLCFVPNWGYLFMGAGWSKSGTTPTEGRSMVSAARDSTFPLINVKPGSIKLNTRKLPPPFGDEFLFKKGLPYLLQQLVYSSWVEDCYCYSIHNC